MNTRDIALSIVAMVAVIAIAVLSYNGNPDGAAAGSIAVIAGAAIGRISGANSAPAEPATTERLAQHMIDGLD